MSKSETCDFKKHEDKITKTTNANNLVKVFCLLRSDCVFFACFAYLSDPFCSPVQCTNQYKSAKNQFGLCVSGTGNKTSPGEHFPITNNYPPHSGISFHLLPPKFLLLISSVIVSFSYFFFSSLRVRRRRSPT